MTEQTVENKDSLALSLALRSQQVQLIPRVGADTLGEPLDFPQYPPERILSGECDLRLYQLFAGQLDVLATRIKPVKVTHHQPFPIDEVLVVLEGELRVKFKGEAFERSYPEGSIVWFPEGMEAETEEFVAGESGIYRTLIITPPLAAMESGSLYETEGVSTQLIEKSSHPQLIPTSVQTEGERLPFPQFPSERILAGESDITLHHLFTGHVDVAATRIKPVKISHDQPFPIDEVLFVLEGELHTQLKGEAKPRVFPAGSIVWVPKGTEVTVEEFVGGDSGWYRSMVITPPTDLRKGLN